MSTSTSLMKVESRGVSPAIIINKNMCYINKSERLALIYTKLYLRKSWPYKDVHLSYVPSTQSLGLNRNRTIYFSWISAVPEPREIALC